MPVSREEMDAVRGGTMIELMDERPGLTMGALLDKLADKLQARETKVFKGKGMVEGDDGKLHEEDLIIYSAPLEAHSIQVQALEMALKLRGAFVTKVEHTGKNGGPIQVQAEMDIGALRNAIKRAQKTE